MRHIYTSEGLGIVWGKRPARRNTNITLTSERIPGIEKCILSTIIFNGTHKFSIVAHL
jgi:hypothetical protein